MACGKMGKRFVSHIQGPGTSNSIHGRKRGVSPLKHASGKSSTSCKRFRICHILVGGACLLATLGLEKGWTNPTAFARAAQYPKFVSGFQVITEVDFSG
jgi:hypothetical protein